jgi:hypothetical protein
MGRVLRVANQSEKEAGGLVVPRLTFIRPLVPSSTARPPKGDDWLHEPKWDGFRFQIIKHGQRCEAPNVVRGSKVEGRSLPPSRSLPKEIRRDAIPKQLER